MSPFLCPNCHKAAVGLVVAYPDNTVVHDFCHREYLAKQKGKTAPCPKCGKSGKVSDKNRPTEWRDDPNSGMDGWFAPTRKIPVAWAQILCDLCDGDGYLEKPPVEITQHVGWRRG